MALGGLIPDIAPHERVRFWCGAFGFGCVAASALVARAAGDAIFLSRFSPTLLPKMYIGSALLLIIVSNAYGAFAGRVAVGRLTAITGFLLALGAVGMRFALTQPDPFFRVMVYFVADVLVNLPMLLFFGFLAHVFDMREGKRLFGLVTSAGTAACIIAGFTCRPFAERFGPENLLLVVAALLAGFSTMVVYLSKREAKRLQPSASRPGGGGGVGQQVSYYTEFLKTRQLRNLALLMLVMTLAMMVVDYNFKTAAKLAYPEGAKLAGFFGQFYGIANILALLLQIFFVHRILQHAGLLASLMVLPVGLAIASAGVAATTAFRWVVVSMALKPIFEFSINLAAIQMLYLGIRKQSRARARTFVEGLCRPLAMAVAGALLVGGALGTMLPAQLRTILAQAVLALCVLWLLLIWRNYKAYMAGLLEAVGAKTVDLESNVRISSRAFEAHIRNTLLTAEDSEVPYVAGLLAELGDLDATPEFRQLLSRNGVEVKVTALGYLALHGGPEDVAALTAHTDHPDPAVRTAAVHALAHCGGEGAVPALEARLLDPDPEVGAAAAAELINIGDLDAFLAAGTKLKGMLGDESPELRMAGTGALSSIKTGGLTRLLRSLLADPDARVRGAAVTAFKYRPTVQLLDDVLPMLADPAVSHAAAEALALLGPASLPVIAVHFERRQGAGDLDAMSHLAGLVADIGHADGMPIIRAALQVPGTELRAGSVAALCQIVEGQPSIAPFTADLDAALHAELESARDRATWAAECANVPGGELLRAAIGDDYRLFVKNVFRLLDVRTPGVDMNTLGFTWLGGGDERRAQILELLDNVLESSIKQAVVGVLENRRGYSTATVFNLHDYLATGNSEWVVVGALHAAAAARQLDAETLRALAAHASADVREYALFCASSHADLATFEQIRGAGLSDGSDRIRRLAADLEGHHGREFKNRMIAVQKVLFLRNVPMFSAMSSREIGHVASIAEEIVYSAGDSIIREGDVGDSLFVIVDGRVRVHRGEMTFSTMGQNQQLGEMSLFDGEPRSASATAETDCVVLRINQTDFHSILARNFGAVLSVLGILTQRIRKKEAEALSLKKTLESSRLGSAQAG